MIYLVTNQQVLFEDSFERVTVQQSLSLMSNWDIVGLDSETSGKDPRICSLLCCQFGDRGENQVIVDCTSVNIALYKDFIESKFIIGHNIKFDLQFLYNHNIIPRRVYDTMIAEQFLHLGWPSSEIKYNLHDVALRRLGINIDKSVRGEIIWRGLDSSVIKYAAGDVQYLYQIMQKQLEDIKKIPNAINGIKIECDCIPAMAYMEWCGIKLDENKWKKKMSDDFKNLEEAKKNLDEFVILTPSLKEFTKVNTQGDLFEGFDSEPKCVINWSSSQQVVKVAKKLGFDVTVKDKKTGEKKESVLEKVLISQKGINDEFLKLYFYYQEKFKVVTSFGQGHLNAVNPKTGRLHTTFKQLGAQSGRMSCGSQQPNMDLAKLKKLNPSDCTYLNLQQLPADDTTRGSFVAPEGNLMVSADFSSEESRLGADIYQDKEMLKEYLEGSGDMHSLFAWMVFRKECEALGCSDVSEVKKKAPKWRKAVKGVEFGWMFGAAAPTLSQTAGCSVEEAQSYIDSLEKGFKGVHEFAKKGSKFVREHGYIVINPLTGHRLDWYDWKEWKERQKSFTSEFWDDYRANHKGTNDNIAKMVRTHFQAAGKYDRLARNCVTQGTGAIIMKHAITQLFNYIVDNGYFSKINLCACVHDEIVCDFPKELDTFPKTLENIMENSASIFCKSLPIPAEASVGEHWIH